MKTAAEILALAETEKSVATSLLSSALGLPADTISLAVKEAVVHIVNAAMLEVTALNATMYEEKSGVRNVG